jgi:hypothetical protein
MRMIKLYAIYDRISKLYHNSLFFHPNDADAKRSFELGMEKSPRPTDYELVYLGSYDRIDGKLFAEDKRSICSGIKKENK